jgi:hypothetical protein
MGNFYRVLMSIIGVPRNINGTLSVNMFLQIHCLDEQVVWRKHTCRYSLNCFGLFGLGFIQFIGLEWTIY